MSPVTPTPCLHSLPAFVTASYVFLAEKTSPQVRELLLASALVSSDAATPVPACSAKLGFPSGRQPLAQPSLLDHWSCL